MKVDEWCEVSLSEVAVEITVGHVGPMAAEYVSSGIPFLRSQNVEPFSLKRADIKFISDEFHSKLAKSQLSPGDVVIVRTGKPGAAAVIPDDLPVANCSDLVIVRPGPLLDSRFLAYYLNVAATHHISSHLVGAVQQHFNVGSARSLMLSLPSISEQESIVSVVGGFDDKIALNLRMNQTLEAMARATFKSWFVDFGPVREGHSLFPRNFQASAKGLIPASWTLGRLDDLIVLQRGFDLPASERQLGQFPVIAASGPAGFHDEAKVNGPGVVTGRSGVLGRVFLILEDFWPLNTTLWVKEFRRSGPVHAYFLLQSLDFEVFNAGSAVPTLNRNHVHNLPVVIPPLPVVEAFEEKVRPLFELQAKNKEQSETLAALRDALLPKLLSGEIRVKQAEKIVGEVV